MTGRTARRRVLRISLPDQSASRADLLAAEEPLGIRVNGAAVTMTMRTPGDDLDLAAGFLAGEGVVRSAADIETIKICRADRCGHADHDSAGNVADVTLRRASRWSRPCDAIFSPRARAGYAGRRVSGS